MNETIKNLLERRSVRGYKEDLVPEEVLNEILEAGEYAPSGMGQQGTLMVVTQNPELVAKLSKMNADVMGTESDPFYGAPTVVVVFADSNMPTCVENGSLVMGNLMNAAHALGVDSCWIHRAREVFASEEGKALKAEWGVPESYVGIGHCVLGYRSGEYPKAKGRPLGGAVHRRSRSRNRQSHHQERSWQDAGRGQGETQKSHRGKCGYRLRAGQDLHRG